MQLDAGQIGGDGGARGKKSAIPRMEGSLLVRVNSRGNGSQNGEGPSTGPRVPVADAACPQRWQDSCEADGAENVRLEQNP